MGFSQARILEWVVISFSREYSWPRDWTWVSCIAGRCFIFWATREAYSYLRVVIFSISLIIVLLCCCSLTELFPCSLLSNLYTNGLIQHSGLKIDMVLHFILCIPLYSYHFSYIWNHCLGKYYEVMYLLWKLQGLLCAQQYAHNSSNLHLQLHDYKLVDWKHVFMALGSKWS